MKIKFINLENCKNQVQIDRGSGSVNNGSIQMIVRMIDCDFLNNWFNLKPTKVGIFDHDSNPGKNYFIKTGVIFFWFIILVSLNTPKLTLAYQITI